ncbi:putative reverse transcriptase domain-containing protein [Tanacetum coccineum]
MYLASDPEEVPEVDRGGVRSRTRRHDEEEVEHLAPAVFLLPYLLLTLFLGWGTEAFETDEAAGGFGSWSMQLHHHLHYFHLLPQGLIIPEGLEMTIGECLSYYSRPGYEIGGVNALVPRDCQGLLQRLLTLGLKDEEFGDYNTAASAFAIDREVVYARIVFGLVLRYTSLQYSEKCYHQVEPQRTTPATTTTPTTTVTNAQLQALIDQGVAAALVKKESLADNGQKQWNPVFRISNCDAYYKSDKYCPRGEIKKLESEYWNLKVRGTDLMTYNQRFQELALMCDRMCQRLVPCKEAIEFATEMMDKKMITAAERQAENKRKLKDFKEHQYPTTTHSKENNVGLGLTTAGAWRLMPYGGTKTSMYQVPIIHPDGPLLKSALTAKKTRGDCTKMKMDNKGIGPGMGMLRKTKSKEKQLEDGVPIVQDFTEVLPEDCREFHQPAKVNQFDLLPGGCAKKEEHGEHLKLILEFLKKEQFQGIYDGSCKDLNRLRWEALSLVCKEIRQFLGLLQASTEDSLKISKSSKANDHAELKVRIKLNGCDKAEAAFQLIKQKLCSAFQFWHLPEGNEDFIAYCDASIKGLGAVLMQREKVIAYASRQLKIHEKNYTTIWS